MDLLLVMPTGRSVIGDASVVSQVGVSPFSLGWMADIPTDGIDVSTLHVSLNSTESSSLL
jgi:hypothetical protein